MTRARGRLGEAAAASFLERQGMTVLARNVVTPYGEIDLICQDDQARVFVEVKWRTARDPEMALAAVDNRKRQRVRRSASHLLARERYTGDVRFDVVGISGAAENVRFEHIRNAF